MWLRLSVVGGGTYLVFPLSPTVIMYSFPNHARWLPTKIFGDCISPVKFTSQMVHNENNGQVFMASRFLISRSNDFEEAKSFVKTIGTDTFRR